MLCELQGGECVCFEDSRRFGWDSGLENMGCGIYITSSGSGNGLYCISDGITLPSGKTMKQYRAEQEAKERQRQHDIQNKKLVDDLNVIEKNEKLRNLRINAFKTFAIVYVVYIIPAIIKSLTFAHKVVLD